MKRSTEYFQLELPPHWPRLMAGTVAQMRLEAAGGSISGLVKCTDQNKVRLVDYATLLACPCLVP